MICPCGGKLQKRISDEGRALECVSCGRYELQENSMSVKKINKATTPRIEWWLKQKGGS